VPRVSVLMPSFNYARYLPFAIESVLSQSYADLELIITDDCSTDGSREIAEQWKHRDRRVVTVVHDVNRGLAAARNSGLEVSSGKFVALCDADDTWLRDKLEIQVECLERDPGLGLVHSDSLIMDREGDLTGQLFSDLVHKKRQPTSGWLFGELCDRNFLCVPTVLARREALEHAGGFDGRLRSLEDWVCWIRVARRYPICYVARPLARYRLHGSNLSSDRASMARNRVAAIQLVLREFPDIPARTRSRMLYSLGVSQLEVGNPEGALEAFTNSIATDVSNVRGWLRCGESYLRRLALW
jgi:glycosyltransferase involved in cell wall biosynthesis